MKAVSGFSKMSKEEKISWLSSQLDGEAKKMVNQMPVYWHHDGAIQKRLDEFSENTLTNFDMPFGIAPNFLINGKTYSVPMVIEESSVVAAASLGAKFWYERGGFTTKVLSIKKVGQIHFLWQGKKEKLFNFFKDNKMDYVTEEIERDDANIRVPVVSHTPMHVSKHADYGKQSQMFSQVGTEKETGTTSTGSINKQALFSVRLHNNSDIYKECSYSSWSTKYANGVLYFMAGRYYSFPWSDTAGTITSHGIDATKHAAPYLEIDAYLLNGYKTMVPYSVDMWTVLQDKHITKDIPRGGVQKYFYEGVMIEDSKVDKFIKNKQYERFKLLDKNPFEKIRQLSSYSAYPVTFSYSESSKVKEAEVLFYQGGRKVLTGKTYQPLFSNRRYGVLEGGKMVAISSYFPKDFILYEDDKDLSIESFINKVQLDSRSKDDADSLEHDFVLLDEYTMIKRYSHLSESIEEDLLQQEEFNGIADTTYFIEPNDRLPLGIEVFTFEGKDVLYAAMFDYVEGYVNMDEDQMSMYAYELATEGLDSGDGLCSFMLKKHGIKFEDFIIDALIGITSDCICEAEEEVGDLLEEHFTDVEFDDVDIATLAIGKNGKISFKNEKGNETL